MEVGDFVRNAGVHIRGILLGAFMLAALLAGMNIMASHPYTSTSTLRVVPPEGQLDTDLLSTSVEWYAALGQVPDVRNKAAALTTPAVSTETVGKEATLAPGAGPGEIVITVTSPEKVQSMTMNEALGSVLVERVKKDPALQLGGTQLTVLVPAADQGQLGSGAAKLFVTGFLAGFVVLFTAAGLLHNFINWRVNSRVLKALGTQRGLRTFARTPEMGVLLLEHSRREAQSWMGCTEAVSATAWTDLEQVVTDLGGQLDLRTVQQTAEPQPATPGTVILPDPNDGGPGAVSTVSRVAAPTVVLVARGTPIRTLRDLLQRLDEVRVPVMALGLTKKG